jgi:hypothetical protein
LLRVQGGIEQVILDGVPEGTLSMLTAAINESQVELQIFLEYIETDKALANSYAEIKSRLVGNEKEWLEVPPKCVLVEVACKQVLVALVEFLNIKPELESAEERCGLNAEMESVTLHYATTSKML